jgi:hypothetical protein
VERLKDKEKLMSSLYQDTLYSAFQDELEKIAGELHGFTRSGRRPLSVDRYLEREEESEILPSDVTKQAGLSPTAIKTIGLMGVGAGTALLADRGVKDWKMGRQHRIASRGDLF